MNHHRFSSCLRFVYALFPLHSHPGDHILYFLAGDPGFVHIDGRDVPVCSGHTIFIPGSYAHGVKTNTLHKGKLRFLAFGVPHKHIQSTERMHFETREGDLLNPEKS